MIKQELLAERTRIAAPPIAAGIWAELMRRRRKDGRFLYPTKLHIGGTAEERQKLAIHLLFSLALEIPENPPRIILRRDFKMMHSNLQAMAEMLRQTVDMAVQSGLRRPHWVSTEPELRYINPLVVAIEEVRDLAAQLDRVVVIERDHRNMREHVVAVGIANVCRLFFGRTMPAVVVGLVKILLDRDIQVSQVRDWCAANCRTTSRALPRKKNKKPILRSYS
jgi:hypothetical protein